MGGFLAILRRTARLVTPAQTFTESVGDADNRLLECAEAAHADFSLVRWASGSRNLLT